MEKSIYDPDLNRLKAMDVRQATALFRELLWCESARLELRNIHVSGDTDTADGGIDAWAERTESTGLKRSDFYFQIKAGQSFKPWLRPTVKKELFGKADPSMAALGAAVRGCLEADGVYVLVAIGHELISQKAKDAREIFLDLFKQCGFPDAKVEIWGADQIGKFIERYPSLALDLNHRGRAGLFQSVASWSENAGMSDLLALGAPQTAFIEDVRRHLLDDSVRHVRVIGEPGAGKSRLVLEALAGEERLSYRTLYVEQASDFQRSPLLNELLKMDREYWVVLVIDDCDERERASIYGLLRNRGRIKLVSIDHGPDDSADAFMKVLQFPVLAAEQVEQILRSYVGSMADVHRWVHWCEGSARVAHAVGQNLESNPQDILKSPAHVDLWGRFIQGYEPAGDSKQVETALEHMALFQRFGFKKPVEAEGRYIADLAAKVDPSLTHGRFDQIVGKLMGRRILQGGHTLRIVPKALHLHLWSRWWKAHGPTADLNDLMADIPGSLQRWFLEMLPYANGVESARSAIKEILSDQASQFESRDFVSSKSGSDFLRAMATAEPAATIASLKRSLGALAASDFEVMGDARSNLTGALCTIAVWRAHFRDAAELLWKLTHGDDSKYSNDTRGSLKGLFNLVGGPTQATGLERLEFASEKFRSTDARERQLGLELCSEILNVRGGIRIVGVEHQGMLDDLPFWRPTYGDWFDAWRSALALLESGDIAEDLDWQASRSRAIVDACYGMLQFPDMHDAALDSLGRQLDFVGADHNALAKTIIHLINYPFEATIAPSPSSQRLQEILAKLGEGSFEKRFDRHVVFELYDEDYSLNAAGEVVECDGPRKTVAKLAKEFVERSADTCQFLPLVLASNGHRMAQFAVDVADLSPDGSLDGPLLTMAEFMDLEGEPVRWAFVAGYLGQVRKSDPSRWEEIALSMLDLDVETADDETGRWRILGVAWSGVSPVVVARMLALLGDRAMGPFDFAPLRHQIRDSGLSVAEVEAVVTALLRCGQEGGPAEALMIAHEWAVQGGHALSQSVLWKVLTDARTIPHGNAVHYWKRVVAKYRSHFPRRDSKLLKAMLRHVGASSSSGYQLADAASKVAAQMCVADPEGAWPTVAKELDGGKGGWLLSRRLSGLNDSSGASPAISAFNVDDVIDWIKKSQESRAPRIIGALPQTLDAGLAGELTRRFIEEFGADAAIASRLRGHFEQGLRVGPASSYLSAQRDQARQWMAAAPTSSHVRKWLDQFIDELSIRIDNSRIAEERGF